MAEQDATLSANKRSDDPMIGVAFVGHMAMIPEMST
jgi:hypothetical protein